MCLSPANPSKLPLIKFPSFAVLFWNTSTYAMPLEEGTNIRQTKKKKLLQQKCDNSECYSTFVKLGCYFFHSNFLRKVILSNVPRGLREGLWAKRVSQGPTWNRFCGEKSVESSLEPESIHESRDLAKGRRTTTKQVDDSGVPFSDLSLRAHYPQNTKQVTFPYSSQQWLKLKEKGVDS